VIEDERNAYLLLEGKVVVFKTQEEAYRVLIPYVRKRLIRSTVLVQFSGSSSFDLLSVILDHVDEGSLVDGQRPVVMYTEHRDVARSLGSKQQVASIKRVMDDKIANLVPERKRHLEVRTYRTPGAISGLHIEFSDERALLLLGFLTYEQAHDHPGVAGSRTKLKRHQYHDDYLRLSAHDRAAILAFRGTPVYDLLYPTFEAMEDNLQVVSLPSDMSWCSVDMNPATVAYYRLGSLLENKRDPDGEDYSAIEASRLGLWAGQDLRKVAALVEGLRAYYATRDPDAVANCNLLLGWTYREVWVGQDADARQHSDYLVRAETSLDETLGRWGKEPSRWLEQAYCYDRLGTIAHLREDYEHAKEHFEKALGLAEGRAMHEAIVLRSWANLNLSMLALDRGEHGRACEYLQRAVKGFDEAQDRRGLLYSIAAAGCLASALGNHRLALHLFGTLPEDETEAIGPTHMRWFKLARQRSEEGFRSDDARDTPSQVKTEGTLQRFDQVITEVRRFVDEGCKEGRTHIGSSDTPPSEGGIDTHNLKREDHGENRDPGPDLDFRSVI